MPKPRIYRNTALVLDPDLKLRAKGMAARGGLSLEQYLVQVIRYGTAEDERRHAQQLLSKKMG